MGGLVSPRVRLTSTGCSGATGMRFTGTAVTLLHERHRRGESIRYELAVMVVGQGAAVSYEKLWAARTVPAFFYTRGARFAAGSFGLRATRAQVLAADQPLKRAYGALC